MVIITLPCPLWSSPSARQAAAGGEDAERAVYRGHARRREAGDVDPPRHLLAPPYRGQHQGERETTGRRLHCTTIAVIIIETLNRDYHMSFGALSYVSFVAISILPPPPLPRRIYQPWWWTREGTVPPPGEALSRSIRYQHCFLQGFCVQICAGVGKRKQICDKYANERSCLVSGTILAASRRRSRVISSLFLFRKTCTVLALCFDSQFMYKTQWRSQCR